LIINERIPRLIPEEVHLRDKDIYLAALRKVRHARTRAAIKQGKRKCILCGMLCSSPSVYKSHSSEEQGWRKNHFLRFAESNLLLYSIKPLESHCL
jgi:hypothetical protein